MIVIWSIGLFFEKHLGAKIVKRHQVLFLDIFFLFTNLKNFLKKDSFFRLLTKYLSVYLLLMVIP